MWKLIKIAQRPYLMSCTLEEDNTVKFILYDYKESWCETLTLEELKRKTKLLNRRYDFSEENARETLMGDGDLELATLEHTETGRTEKFVLKLKYRVKNCPFHFDWSLKRQTMLEFQTTFVRPLCIALMGCHEQNEILTDTLKKKDAEILQYRTEGAILSRKTLATKLFDFEEFGKKYEDCNRITAELSEFGKFLLNNEIKKENKSAEKVKESPEKVAQKPDTVLWSPGQRKRKIQELKQKHLERNIKNRKQNIVYENSQSEDITSDSSQSTELNIGQKKPDTESNIATPTKELTQKKAKTQIDTTIDLSEDATKPKMTISDKQRESSQSCKPLNALATNDKESTSKITNNPLINNKDSKGDKNISQQDEIKTPSKSTALVTKKGTHSIEIKSDSDSEDIILTPKKRSPLPKKRSRDPNHCIVDTDSDTDDTIVNTGIVPRNLNNSLQEEERTEEAKTRSAVKQKALRSLAFPDVVEISTDSDCSSSTKIKTNRYPKRRNTTCTPTKTTVRVTRSSPQGLLECKQGQNKRRNSLGMMPADLKIFDSPNKKTSSVKTSTKPVIVGEISSQLDAIRKELKSLEALRLADLKQRTCKV